MLKRHEIQLLRRAGHTWAQVAQLAGVSVGTARRVTAEDRVTTVDSATERERRQIGRPSKADAYCEVLVQALTEPTVNSMPRKGKKRAKPSRRQQSAARNAKKRQRFLTWR